MCKQTPKRNDASTTYLVYNTYAWKGFDEIVPKATINTRTYGPFFCRVLVVLVPPFILGENRLRTKKKSPQAGVFVIWRVVCAACAVVAALLYIPGV